MNPEDRLKMVTVGDSCVGKTALFHTAIKGQFPTEYLPRTFEGCHIGYVTVNGQQYEYTTTDIFDEPVPRIEELRLHIYYGTSVFLVCFSLVDPESLANVERKWIPEIKQIDKGRVPMVLVGTKLDLRNVSSDLGSVVSTAEGKEVADKLNMASYVECSAKDMINIDDVFTAAALAALQRPLKKRPSRRCVVF